MDIVQLIVSLFTGAFISMGMGGGCILILYLTIHIGMSQIQAQGINLVFFFICSCVASVIHMKEKMIDWRISITLILTGIIGSTIGFFLLNIIDIRLIQKIFAISLLIIAYTQLRK